MCTWKCTRRGMFTLSCHLPLMIVVITSSGKSHFHKATFFSPCDVTLFPSQVCSLLPPSFSVVSLLSLPLFSLLSYAYLRLSSFSSSPSYPHLPPIPCDLLIPLSYSVFCLEHIFPPTRPRLIPLSFSIYLYQWAKVILSSSSIWADSACERGQEKRGAEEHSFSYLSFQLYLAVGIQHYINSSL